jgi:hypothetical protein
MSACRPIDELDLKRRAELLVIRHVACTDAGRGQEALWILLGAVMKALVQICGATVLWNTIRRMDLVETGEERG